MIKTVILAAGPGSRFQNQGVSTPKPLVRMGGLTLLERTVNSAARAGSDEFVIVVGDFQDQIKATIGKKLEKFNVQWVYNKDWPKGNGTSLLATEPYIEENEPFLVLMCDHLLFPKTLSGLWQKAQTIGRPVMAVDRKDGLISDMQDATKVRISAQKITKIGKKLNPYDAIDVGASICTREVFQGLKDLAEANNGGCSHSGGMQKLAENKSLHWYDIGLDCWEDVDDPASLKAASKILFNSLRKPTDGFLSRHLERRLSLTFTRLLASAPIRPNAITVALVFVGFIAAYLFSRTDSIAQIAGAIVFWMSSFLDGCDGEIARLKFMETRLGGWLDLWSDNLVHMMVFTGIGVGEFRATGHSYWIYLSVLAVLGVFLSVSLVSYKTSKRNRNAGPLFTSIAEEEERALASPAVARLMDVANALSRRDFIFWLIFITILGWEGYFLWAASIGTIAYFCVLLIIQRNVNRANAEI